MAFVVFVDITGHTHLVNLLNVVECVGFEPGISVLYFTNGRFLKVRKSIKELLDKILEIQEKFGE